MKTIDGMNTHRENSSPVLVVTVGKNPFFIGTTIAQHKPKFVVFFTSPQTATLITPQGQAPMMKGDTDTRGILQIAKEHGHDMDINQFEIHIVSHLKLSACLNAIQNVLQRIAFQENYKIAIDHSGGIAVMNDALSLISQKCSSCIEFISPSNNIYLRDIH